MMIDITLPNFDVDFTPMRREFIEEAPTTIGIYFIFNNTHGLMYVGKASNLRSRLMTHRPGNMTTSGVHMAGVSHLFDSFRYIRCNNRVEADIYETYAINTFKPHVNRDKTWTYKTRYPEFTTERLRSIHALGI